MDGIARRPLDEKRFGLFECDRVSDHPLMAGIPSRLAIPHSRWNDLREAELAASGYYALTRAEDAGADTFVKQRDSLFVFFQGHPEYEANTLLREYIRDVGRYLSRQTDTYPAMPRAYFDRDTADALTAIRDRALHHRHQDLLGEFPAALSANEHANNTWRSSAARIYGNWLRYLCARKDRRSKERQSKDSQPARHRELASNRQFAPGA